MNSATDSVSRISRLSKELTQSPNLRPSGKQWGGDQAQRRVGEPQQPAVQVERALPRFGPSGLEDVEQPVARHPESGIGVDPKRVRTPFEPIALAGLGLNDPACVGSRFEDANAFPPPLRFDGGRKTRQDLHR